MMSKVNNENFIVIQGWMINELGLKGNELLIYALIYGFSQDGEQRFNGSLQYIADWTNSTKSGVSKALKKLVEKGLLIKNDKIVNGVKFCEYYTTKLHGGIQQSYMGYTTKLHGGMQQSYTNNIDNNISNKLINNIDRVDYQQIVDMYNETCVSFPRVIKLTESRKKAIKARLRRYSMDELQKVFTNAENSDFLKGDNDRNWNADFDWMLKEANTAKIFEGKYNEKIEPPKKSAMGTSFMDLDF